jgi:hypothetical protein
VLPLLTTFSILHTTHTLSRAVHKIVTKCTNPKCKKKGAGTPGKEKKEGKKDKKKRHSGKKRAGMQVD